jgi:hypothetical protein
VRHGPGAASAESRERRAARRVLAALEAGYQDHDRQVFLRTRDLSESGVFLLGPESPEVGAQAQLLLELPGQPALLRLRGTVIRHEAGPPSGFALRFDESLGIASLAALRDYVEREDEPGGPA